MFIQTQKVQYIERHVKMTHQSKSVCDVAAIARLTLAFSAAEINASVEEEETRRCSCTHEMFTSLKMLLVEKYIFSISCCISPPQVKTPFSYSTCPLKFKKKINLLMNAKKKGITKS